MKSIFFFLLVCSHIHAQVIFSHNLDVTINVENKKVFVEGYLEADFQSRDSISFVLWKNSYINEISCSGRHLNYDFDTLSSSPIMYIPKGRKLTVINEPGMNGRQPIRIRYNCDMSSLQGWANSFTEEWIELNFYCAWFPVIPGSRNFTSALQIHIDDAYSVTGSGIISKKEKFWEMLQPWGSFDIVIIASKKLKNKVVKENDALVQSFYNAGDFSEIDSDSVLAHCRYSLNLFEQSFGKIDSTYLKFVIAPFHQGGYSRKNFVCMRSRHFDINTIKGIAHEIAHFWWTGASTTSWEDWLNEAFAEYSMLMYIRNRFGAEEFDKQVNEYKSRIKNSPPIWGIERNAPEAYTVLYEKGSLILLELENKTGKDRFLDFLKELLNQKIKSTQDFLNLAEKKFSQVTRSWIENKLKSN